MEQCFWSVWLGPNSVDESIDRFASVVSFVQCNGHLVIEHYLGRTSPFYIVHLLSTIGVSISLGRFHTWSIIRRTSCPVANIIVVCVDERSVRNPGYHVLSPDDFVWKSLTRADSLMCGSQSFPCVCSFPCFPRYWASENERFSLVRNRWPNNISLEKRAVDSRGVLQWAKRRWSIFPVVQLTVSLCMLSMVCTTRSARPLRDGWHGAVFRWRISFADNNCLNSELVNWGPLSVHSVFGMPWT